MSDHEYVARFGLTPRDLIMVPACAIFVLVGVAAINDGQLLMGIGGCLLGGVYLFLLTMAVVGRRAALAVTAEGITFGQAPLWKPARNAFVPWSDITTVVLWKQPLWRHLLWRQYQRYVGVARRPGSPALTGSAENRTLRKLNQVVSLSGQSEDVVADSRAIAFWRLDKERFVAAVEHFAPGVPIIDEL